MSDIKTRPWHEYFLVGLICASVSFAGILALKYTKDYNLMMHSAETHIKTVIATDRNCNDCHLGASFINLFKHDAVKNNDNIVLLMMDKAHIKRW